MRLTRISIRSTTLAIAATTTIIGGLLVASPAHSAPTSPDTSSGASAASGATTTARAEGIVAQLGARTAGSYLDAATGRLVVTVTDSAAAAQVQAAGLDAKVVTRSGARLAAATATLDRSAGVAGTAWAVDPVSNQVVLTIDGSVKGAALAKVNAAAAGLGDAVRVEHVAGTFSLRISGGDAIYGGQYRCSLGFNVHSGSTYYFLTAGHCGNIAATWYSNSNHSTVLGSTTGSTFPGSDYAIVRYTNTSISHPSTVGSVNITGAGTPTVGQTVSRRGSTTGTHSGRVTALNATVNYAEGTVRGLIRTTVCAEGGDSGGALYAGSTAYGLTSGGSGNCRSGGVTFFQPVTAALSRYGVTIP